MEPYPLVSIIVPVYNGRVFLDRFMRMILMQTYLQIELVIVDDGSEDGSYEYARSWAARFDEKGCRLRCFRQMHRGQAAAVNCGLREFTGQYLKWMDCDDLLEPECVMEEMVFLNDHPECGFVICDSRYVNEELETIRIFGRKTAGAEDRYFRDILCGTHNYSLGSGTILVSREKLQKVIPDMQIIESAEGQNYQLMLPLTYHYQCGYLHRPLFIRTVRKDSHSRKERTYAEQKERWRSFIALMKETIRRMNIAEEEEAAGLIEQRFGHLLYGLAYDHQDMEEAEYWRTCLKSSGSFSRKEEVKWFIMRHPLLYRFHQSRRGRTNAAG